MAHFAQLDENNVVINVFVINNEDIVDDNGIESEQLGIDLCKATVDPNGVFVQTSYNGSFRKNFAGFFFTYDSQKDAFIPPQIYDSWTLDAQTCKWVPPIARPDDGLFYEWDEDSQTWVLITTN